MELTVFIILTLVIAAQAGPVDTVRDACATKCYGTNKFGYKSGTAYEFDYKSTTSTSIKGASEGVSNLELTAKVHIEAISKCDYLLKITKAQLRETDPNNYESMVLSVGSHELSQILQNHNLRFSFQDGIIEDICPASSENLWALNIKRAILSVFQNTMDDLNRNQKVKETDVAGNCDTEYTVSDSGRYNIIIQKSKNLIGCTDRQSYSLSIRSTPYMVPSDIQTLPLMKSEHNCQQVISSEGYLMTATCLETQVFRPFSRHGSGAMTESRQTLSFVRERVTASPLGSVRRRADLLFEHIHGSNRASHNHLDMERKLTEICENTMENVGPTTPQLFTELVYLMKSVSELSLKLVYNKIRQGQLCSNNNRRIRKFFLDAIPMVGTSASLRLLTEFINDNTVSGIEADMWLTSLSFIQHPTKPMLKDVLPLLNGDSGKAMLPVASLVNSYCKEHSCENDKDVENIINSMQSKIGPDCLIDDNNVNQVIMSLRSIGNAGHAVSAITTINSCITKTDNPMEVRLAGIEAFRRMPCNGNRSELISVFVNQEEEAELRIAAYLALMECVDEYVLQIIKETLRTEEINQVGSFVWSHLTNLKQTSNPLKQDVRFILENEDLRKEFDLDKRKFSRNYEWSFFQEKLNTGASVESNLIWSKDSFIPRSASANLTVDLFGRSINLIEIGGRVKGLEYFLESYFGPNGYFGGNSENRKKPKGPSISEINKKKMKNIDRQFLSARDEFKGALYMRIFGNELGYKMFGGKEPIMGDDFNILQMLITLSKQNDYSLSQSLMFIDSSISIPTSSGFPMTLDINGTANIDLKVAGKFDVRKLAASPRSVAIHGSIEPSAVIQTSSMMSIDAFVTKSGLKMVSTLHTSTALQGRIELQNGRIFSSEIDIPRQKMEVFNLRTHFFTVHNNEEKEQQMIEDNRQTKTICSGSTLAKAVGLELCGEISYPNASLKADAPYFPLTGPVSMGVELVKRDTHHKYILESRFTKSSESNVMRVLFDTPGSFVDRKFEVDVTLDKIQKTLKMSFASPWKMALLSGSITDDTTLRQFQGSFVMDNEPNIAVLAEVRKSKDGTSYVYAPKFEVQIPQKQTISLIGSIEYQPKKVFDADFTLAGILPEPINVKGNFEHKKFVKIIEGNVSFQKGKVYSVVARLQHSFSKRATTIKPYVSIRTPTKDLMTFVGGFFYKVRKSLTIDMTVSKILAKDLKIFVRFRERSNKRYQTSIHIKTPILVTKLRSSIGLRGFENANIRTTLEYVLPRVFRDRLLFNGKMISASTRGLKKLKGNLKLVSRHLPNCNYHLIVDANTNQKKTDADISLNYGFSKYQNIRRIVFSTSMVHQMSWTTPNFAFVSKFQHSGYGLDIETEGKHTHSNKQLTNTFNLLSGKKTLISTAIHLTDNAKQKSGNLQVAYPGRVIKASNHLILNDFGEYSNILNIQYQPGKESIVRLSYGHPSKKVTAAFADFDISDMTRVKLFGEFGMANANNFINTSVVLGQENYSLIAKLINGPNKYGVTTDVQWPARRITVDLDTKYGLPVFMGKADIKWNTDSDISKRFLLDCKAIVENKNSIDAYINHQSPLGTSRVDIKHRGGNLYVTNMAVEWGNFHRITIDTTFSQKRNNVTQHLLGIIKITSPFRGYRSIDVDANYQSDAQQILSKFELNWKPMKPISMHLNWKHPTKWSSFGGSVVLNTPHANIKKTSFEFAHSLRNNVLKSISKFTWNRNLVQLRFDGTRKVFGRSRDFNGRINFKSTIKDFESVFINGRHFSDEFKCQNSLTFERNAEGISYVLEMLHQRTGWEILNKGRVLITLSSGEISSEWSHQNTDSQINSSILSHWGPHSLEMKLHGEKSITFEKGTATSSMHITGSFVPEIEFLLSHHHDIGKSKSNSMMKLKKENHNILSVTNNYQRANGKLESSQGLELSEKSYAMEFETAYIPYPLTAKMKLQWAPDKKVTFESTLDVNNDLYNGKVKLISHVKSVENIIILLNQKRILQTTFTTLSLQYHPRKTLSLEHSYRWDRSKQIRFSLTTPFSRFRSIKSGVDFTGSMPTFSFTSMLEVQPMLSTTSLSSQCSLIGGILCSVELRTAFQNFAYSKIELSSSTEEHMRKNILTIEYQPTKVIKFQNTYRLDSENMMASISVTTPFEAAPRIAVSSTFTGSNNNFRSSVRFEGIHNQLYECDLALNNDKKLYGTISIKSTQFDDIIGVIDHEHKNHYFKTHGELQYQNGEKFQIDTTFNLNNNLEGNVIVKSPYWSDLSASIYHSGNFKLFETRADIQYGQQHSRLAVNFANENTIEGSVLLTCPLINKMAATFLHSGDINNFQSQGEFEYMRGQKIVTMVAFKNTDNVQGTFHFTSPFTHPVEALLEHSRSISNFHTRIRSLDHNGRKINLSTKFAMNENLEGIFELKTPFSEDIIINVFHSIDTKQIQSRLILQCHPNRKFETNVRLHYGQGIESSLQIRTPFTDEISASFNFFRNSLNVTCLSNVQYGQRTFEWDMSLKGGKKVIGSVSIKTPFTYVKSASFNYDRSMNEFQGHAETELWQNEKYEADVNLARHSQMKGSLVLKIPNRDNFKATFSHKGQFAKFKSLVNVLYSKNQKISFDVSFGLKPNKEFIISLTTPFRSYNKLRFSTSHRGTWKDFTVKTMIARGRSAITSNIIFKTKPVIHGEISIITPITGYRNLGALFTHNTSSTYFNSKAEIRYTKNKKIASNVFVQKQPFMFVTIIETPFKGLELQKLLLANEGSLSTFQSIAEISWSKRKKIMLTAKIDTKSSVEVKIGLQTSFKKLEHLGISLLHSGSLQRFNSYAEVSLGKKIIGGNFVFTFTDSMSGSFTLKTPFRGYRMSKLTFSNDGTLNNFRSYADLLFMGRKNELDLTFSTLNNIECLLSIKSAYFSPIRSSFYYSSTRRRLKSNISAHYGSMELLYGQIAFVSRRKATLTASLRSVWTKMAEANIIHEGSVTKFMTKMHVLHDNNQHSKLELIFDSTNHISSKLKILTPYRGMESLRSSLVVKGQLSRFQSHWDGAINSHIVEVDILCNFINRKRASFSLKTPLKTFYNINANFILEDQSVEVKLSKDKEIVKGLVELSFENGLAAKANLQTPWTSDIVATISHSGSHERFLTSGEIIYSGKKQLVADASFVSSPFILLKSSVITSSKILRNMKIAFSHDGYFPSFSTSAELNINAKIISGQMNMQTNNGIEGRFFLETPYTSDLMITFTQNGELMSMRTTTEITCNKVKEVTLNTHWDLQSQKEITFNLETPIHGFENVAASVRLIGDKQNLEINSVVTYYRDRTVIIKARVIHGQNHEVSFDIQAPFVSDMKVSYVNKGSSGLDAVINVLYDGQEKLHTQAKVSNGDTFTATIISRSVLSGLENIQIDFMYQNDNSVFKTNANMLKNKQKYAVDVALSNTVKKYVVFNVNSPLTKTISTSVAYQNANKTLISSLEGQFGDHISSGEVSISWENSYDAFFKLTNIVSLFVENANQVYGKFSHSGDGNQIQSYAELSYIPLEKFTAEISLSENARKVLITTPLNEYHELSLQFTKTVVYDEQVCKAEITFAQGNKIEVETTFKTGDINEKLITIKTPFKDYESFSATLRREVLSAGFSSLVRITDAQDQVYEASILIKKSSGFEAVMTLKTPFTGFEQILSSIKQQWTQNAFTCRAEVANTEGNIIESGILFQSNSKFKGRMYLKTPLKGLRDISASFDHKRSLTSIISQAHLQYKIGKRIELHASIQKTNKLISEIILKTPFSGYEQSKFLFSHLWMDEELQTVMELECVRKFEGVIELTTSMPMTLFLSIKTPFNKYRIFESRASYIASPTGVASNAELQLNDKMYGIEMDIALIPTLNTTVRIKTPFSGWRSLTASIYHTGSFADHLTNVELVFGNQERIVATSEMKSGNGLESRTSLSTPFPSAGYTEVSFHFLENNAHAEVIYGNQQKLETDILFQTIDKLQGSISVRTPFSGYEVSQASLIFENTDSGITSLVEMINNDRRIKGEMDVIIGENTFSLTTSLSTPYENLQNIGLNLKFHGDKNNAKGDLILLQHEQKTITMTIKHVMDSYRMDHAIKISSVYFDDVMISVYHNGNWDSFSSSAVFSIGSDSTNHNLVTNIDADSIHFNYEATATVGGNHYISKTALSHEGNWHNFKTIFLNELNGRKDFVLEAFFRNSDVKEGTLIIKTPFRHLRNINAGFDFAGDISQFKTKGFIKYSLQKQIRISIDFFKHRFSRINGNFEMTTPFEGLEETSISVRHNINKNGFKCMAESTYGLKQRVKADLKLLWKPLTFEAAIASPVVGFEEMSLNAKYTKQEFSTIIDVCLKYATGKDIKFHSSLASENRPIALTMTLITPFSGYENTEVTYTHTGNLHEFMCSVELHASYTSSLSGSLSYRIRSPDDLNIVYSFSSPFDGFQMLNFLLRNQRRENLFLSHSEISWSVTDKVALDFSVNSTENMDTEYFNVDVALTTPLQSFRTMSIKSQYQHAPSFYKETVVAQYDNTNLIDMEMGFGSKPSYVIFMGSNKPRAFSFVLKGQSLDTDVSGDVYLDWNTEDKNSNIRVQTFLSNQDASLKVIHPQKIVEARGSLSKSLYGQTGSGLFFIDGSRMFGMDCEIVSFHKHLSNLVVLYLPDRSINLYGILKEQDDSHTFEVSVMWDAENDTTKKLGMSANFLPDGESRKANLTVIIGKDVKVDSEITLNDGDTLLGGRAEIQYSEDTTKNLIIQSRLENLSSELGKNISLMFGLTHQYSTLDIQMVSHIGHVTNKYIAGVDFHYLTAERNKRNVRLMGQIDSLKKQILVDIDSPMKSMRISGAVESKNPYRISLVKNDEKPYTATLSLHRNSPSVDITLVNLIENVSSEFHIIAGYVSDSAIKTEVYHQEGSEMTTDILLAVQLNAPETLHTRIHWNPTVITDIKSEGLRQIESNSRSVDTTLQGVSDFLKDEMDFKYRTIRNEIIGQIQLPVKFAKSFIQELRQKIIVAKRELTTFLQDNTIITQSICSRSDVLVQNFDNACSQMLTQLDTISFDLEASKNRMVDFPLKEQIELYKQRLSNSMNEINADGQMIFEQLVDNVHTTIGDISLESMEKLDKYRKLTTELVSKVSSANALELLKSQYNQYLEYATEIPLPHFVNDIANKYSGAKDALSKQFPRILHRPEMEYLKSQANEAYELGIAAVKFWEVDESINVITTLVNNYITEIIDAEIEKMKALTSHFSSETAVYDLALGEIQIRTNLPVTMTSLKVLPKVDITKRLNRLKSYIPNISKISNYLPSTDNIPPFTASATVTENIFTTFDGKTYHFDGQCSYVLAKDFVDANFTAVLHFIERNKRKLILYTRTTSIQLLPNGNVRVGKSIVVLPYVANDVNINQEENSIIVKGRGFTLIYDVPNVTFKLTLSGWFFTKTGGLLGTYDNERYDDLMTPSNRIVRSVNDFANAWDVGEKC